MRKNYGVSLLLLALIQVVICNYFRLGPFIMVSLLPVAVLCLPLKHGTFSALLIAFALGLAVDALAEGTLGLNVVALLPVAYIRRPLCRTLFGDETVERGEDFSFQRFGLYKLLTAATISQGLFLLVYFIADGASSMSFWFNLGRFALSLLIGVVLSLVVMDLLKPESRR